MGCRSGGAGRLSGLAGWGGSLPGSGFGWLGGLAGGAV
jgi:hypothetical protein